MRVAKMPDSYEFDFHPVGDASRSGEAITAKIVREGVTEIIVVDGGTSKSGAEVSDRISDYYGTCKVNHMILTHADDDHSSGLREILDNCDVKVLWMNRPWLYAAELTDKFKGNWTAAGLEKELRECFPIVAELEEKAIEAGIPIYEAFQGAQIGALTVVSPSRAFYLDLLPNMSRTPEPAVETKMEGMLQKSAVALMKAAATLKETVLNVFESWDIETLTDAGETSPSNESSVVLYGTVDDRNILLTGDAGQQALTRSADYCDQTGRTLQNFRLVSIPHHGSRRNVGPTLLNRLLGQKVTEGSEGKFSAIVSAAKDDNDHPKRVVMNAFKRRGGSTAKTEGQVINSRLNLDMRPGFSPTEEIPIYGTVEE